MEKLYFIFVIILGSVLYTVAEESSTQPGWDTDNGPILNNMQKWLGPYQQQAALANKNGNIGVQTALNPTNQFVSDVAQGLVPSRDNKTNSYDLREAMGFLNASYGFPMAVPMVLDSDTTHNGSDDQVAAFSAMFNSAASAIFRPESIPNYLILLQNVTDKSDNSSVPVDETETMVSDALTKQFEREYHQFEVLMSRFTEKLHANKTSDNKAVSQNHINDAVSNINSQLSQVLKWPENGKGRK